MNCKRSNNQQCKNAAGGGYIDESVKELSPTLAALAVTKDASMPIQRKGHQHPVPTYSNAEMQTELHPEPRRIVEGYSWNEWDYRKRALILNKLYRSATHSTQTFLQCAMPSEGTQTHALKNHRTQTDRSVYVEAPRSQAYFYGLRGYHRCMPLGKTRPHIVELTREPLLDMKVKFATPKPRKCGAAREPDGIKSIKKLL